MLLTILLTAVLLLHNHVQSFGEFTALCLVQFIVWLALKMIGLAG